MHVRSEGKRGGRKRAEERGSNGERERSNYGRTVAGREVGRDGNFKGGTLDDTGQYAIVHKTTHNVALALWYHKLKIVNRYSI